MKTIYCIFSGTDLGYKNAFNGIINNENHQLKALSTSEQENLFGKSEKAIKDYLRPRIKQADKLVVLVGKDTHSKHYCQYEVEVGLTLGINFIAIDLPVENPGGLPVKLKNRRDVKRFNWNSKEIINEING